MARLPELNFRRDSSLLLRDKEREPYNGYITTTIPSIDKPNVVSWSLLNGRIKFGPVEAGMIFIAICVVWLLFASIPETWLLGLCGVLQQAMAVFLPLICLVCVFYWAELLVQKYCKTRVSLAVFPICAVGEVSTHILFDGVFFDSSDFLRTSFLFTLILAGLVSATFHRLSLIPSSIILLILSLSRMCCWATAYELHSWFGPILAYSSAFAGLILSRNVQGIFTQAPIEVESKVPIIRRTRRSSSVSSTSSLSSNRRRTSLPALGIQNKGAVDYTTLGEAHGMISDLLADSNLAPNVASTLKLISTMIAPPTAFHGSQGPFINRMSPLVERFRHESLEDKDKVKDQPDLKDDMMLPMIGRLRRSMVSSGRRMSSTYTTTTSATGMPTVDPDLTMLRAPSLNEISPSSGGNSPRLPLNLSLDSSPQSSRAQENFAKHKPTFFGHNNAPASPNFGRKSPDRQPPSPNLKRRSSDRPNLYTQRHSKEDIREGLESQSDTHLTEIDQEKAPCNCNCHERTRKPSSSKASEDASKPSANLEPEKFELPCSEEISRIMDKITDWNFPIFDACDQGFVLCQVAYRIFRNVGFFETFKIPERKFLNYFFALESGYHEIPYHNSIHASDVLHGVYYMTTAKVPGFCPPGTPRKMDNESDSDSDSGITSGVLGEGDEEKKDDEDSDYGCLIDSIPLLELLSLYTAAAMHDYDHPGRTNAFLVATLSQQALLYNDRSVLENHHAASAFTLLMSDPKYNFLCELNPSEFKRFRFLAIEAILATDLKRHFDILSDFNAKTAEGGVNWDSEADRLLTLQFCIKMSDISGPSKRRDIHTLWTERIVEEFYEQGDDERERGMAVSPYMDRNQPHVAQLQDSFINHLVAPLYNSYSNAGLLPGTWVEEEESSPDTESDGNESDNEEPATSEEESREKPKKKKTRRRKRRKIVSDITANIQRNYKMWRQRVKETEREQAKSIHDDELENDEELDDDPDDDTTGIIITETPIREDTIEEEENGSECSSTTTDSRKDADI